MSRRSGSGALWPTTSRPGGPSNSSTLVRPARVVRLRATADGRATVAVLAAREPLHPGPPARRA